MMRSQFLAFSLAVSSLFVSGQAQLLPFLEKGPAHHKDNDLSLSGRADLQKQQPLATVPGLQSAFALMEDNGDDVGKITPSANGVSISDVIGNEHMIKIFASLTRDIDSIAQRLESTKEKTTLLAPLNSIMSDLPRKPWEDPRDYSALGATAYDGADGESRAHANLRRFTEAHVIPVSPWKEGDKINSLGGGALWWEIKDGKTFLHPGSIEVDRVISRATNGEVWVIKGVINYAS